MLSRLSMLPSRVPRGSRLMSDARPMTRFIQYPFDKTKMAEVTEWVNSTTIAKDIRSAPGVKDVEVSFCPGEGWLAARYILCAAPTTRVPHARTADAALPTCGAATTLTTWWPSLNRRGSRRPRKP